MKGPEADKPFTFDDPADKLADPARLGSLRNTGLLVAQVEPALDAITRLAARTTAASAAVVSLITSSRQVHPSFFGGLGLEDAPHDAPISHSFCQFVVANDAPLVVEDASTHPVLCDHPAVLEDGVRAYAGYPLHDPDGQVLGALCVVDVVPRPWAEQQLSGLRDLAVAAETEIALRLSRRATHLDHERLLRVLNGAENTMFVIADADGVLVTMNRAAASCLGQDAALVVGAWTLSDLAEIARPCGPKTGPGEARDWALARAQGPQPVISVQLSTVHDVNGDVEGYVIVGDDVTVRRQVEQVLRDTVRKQADVVKRLEALDTARRDFVAVASHELRTPVTSILGCTELLVDGAGGELTATQVKLLGSVERNSRRLSDLVEDLLSLKGVASTDDDPVHTSVDGAAIATCAWQSLQVHLDGREVTTDIDIEPQQLPLLGNPVQLERALLNLLTNAIKFTPDGGCVRLVVSGRDDGVVFEVSDTGMGIPAEEHRAVFDPFFRTQAAQIRAIPGSGIGLTVARRITEEHGGDISLVSEPGRGTTVSMTIPLADTQALATSTSTGRPRLRRRDDPGSLTQHELGIDDEDLVS